MIIQCILNSNIYLMTVLRQLPAFKILSQLWLKELLSFVGNVVTMTKHEQDLQNILSIMNGVTKKDFKMKIDKQNIKILICRRDRLDRTGIKLKNKIIWEVEEFSYLGCNITSDGRSCREIIGRINQAFNKKKPVLVFKEDQEVEEEILTNLCVECTLYVVGERRNSFYVLRDDAVERSSG